MLQAEEAQRKLRKQNGEDTGKHTCLLHSSTHNCLVAVVTCFCVPTALPPPVPPALRPLFASLVNLLQCDVLLAVQGTVLQWAVEPSGGGWTESMLQRVRV